jgi:hypothetical protein
MYCDSSAICPAVMIKVVWLEQILGQLANRVGPFRRAIDQRVFARRLAELSQHRAVFDR